MASCYLETVIHLCKSNQVNYRMVLYPFLTFNGNCKEAMHFYQACFGGELQIRYLGDGTDALKFPEAMQQLIVRAVLTTPTLQLIGSDLGGEEGLAMGNGIALLVKTDHQNELKVVYDNLAKGTHSVHTLLESVQEGEMLSLTDQFGICWLLYY